MEKPNDEPIEENEEELDIDEMNLGEQNEHDMNYLGDNRI